MDGWCISRRALLATAAAPLLARDEDVADPRHIANGSLIAAQGYADQPYVVKTNDGAWLCCATVGSGREGEPGQHVATFRSTDLGRTWSDPVAVEPPDGPEASYAVMLKTPAGRVYVFYNHNTDNLRKVKADRDAYPDGWCRRVDSLGYFVFKYSDDHGRTWSKRRYLIPVREFEIDRRNAYGGEVRFFWNVGKAFAHNGAGYVPLIKVGGFGRGFFTSNEGALLRSPNILDERDPEKIEWQTLPEGDVGLRTPKGGGPIAAEQSYSVLSDGSFFVVYRSVDGHPVSSYSRDGGGTWSAPAYQRYADGRRMKHPRAANFAWKASNGKFLYWFHNHGGRSYADRNPAWLSGGVERDSPDGKVIAWSQPEIVLYADDPSTRMSYPDFIEQDGRYFLTETQKVEARVHEIDRSLLQGLWRRLDPPSPVEAAVWQGPSLTPAPTLPALRIREGHGSKRTRAGFTFEARIEGGEGLLASTRQADGRGWSLERTAAGTIELALCDGRSESRWDSDQALTDPRRLQHVVAIVDGGPGVILFVVDGKLCDGGEERQFGWGRLSPDLYDVNGAAQVRANPAARRLQIYDRALRVSEAVALSRI